MLGAKWFLGTGTNALMAAPVTMPPIIAQCAGNTSSSKAVLALKAAYHKTGAAISHGTLASAVTVSITYN